MYAYSILLYQNIFVIDVQVLEHLLLQCMTQLIRQSYGELFSQLSACPVDLKTNWALMDIQQASETSYRISNLGNLQYQYLS